jgi:hypothetical protein
MQITLKLSASDLRESDFDELSRRLRSTLDHQDDVSASLAEGQQREGQKGDYTLVGQIVLSLIGTGGVVTSLITVLKAYVEQQSSLKVDFQRPDGAKLSLEAANLKQGELDRTTEMLAKFLNG